MCPTAGAGDVAFGNKNPLTLIHLDEPFDGHGVLQLLGDELPKPMKEIGGCLAVDADQIRRTSGRDPANKKLGQSILRLFLEQTAAYPHSLILDPLRIWDSPKNFLPYQSRCAAGGS